MKRTLFVLFAALFATVGCANAWAQATAQIGGTVKDQTGAVLPGVEVTVTQTETGATRTAVTNETGSYQLPNLPIGPYKLEAACRVFGRTRKQESCCRSMPARSSIPFLKSDRSPNRFRWKLMPRSSKRAVPASVRLSKTHVFSNCR